MHAARTGYRQEQDARLRNLEAENTALKQKIATLEAELMKLKGY
jgi:cell division protein FtsB